MSQEQLAINFIVDASNNYEAKVLDRKLTEATFLVTVRRADGKQVPYRILACAQGTEVNAKEDDALLLPSFCPDRHINSDGSFCLYWSDEFAIHITNAEAAGQWWKTLHEFLRLQERADYAREWTGPGWAHGKAARYQRDASNAATSIGKRFVTALQRQQLTVLEITTPNLANGMTLHLLLEGVPICYVRQNKMRITGQYDCRRFRIRRKGKSARKLSEGQKRSKAYAILTLALWNWKVAEDDYWEGYAHRECCGKLDNCRLRNQGNKRGVIHV